MNSELDERISIDPEVCHGKPCIKSTRIPVELILELLEAGESIEGILEMYPHIKRDNVFSCIRYARKLVENITKDELAHRQTKTISNDKKIIKKFKIQ